MKTYLGEAGLRQLTAVVRAALETVRTAAAAQASQAEANAKAASRPSTWVPTAGEVGALPASTAIPTKTSQLANDSGFVNAAQLQSTAAQKQNKISCGTADLTAGVSPLADGEIYLMYE